VVVDWLDLFCTVTQPSDLIITVLVEKLRDLYSGASRADKDLVSDYLFRRGPVQGRTSELLHPLAMTALLEITLQGGTGSSTYICDDCHAIFSATIIEPPPRARVTQKYRANDSPGVVERCPCCGNTASPYLSY
jgi:hypothetical protein